MTRTAGLLVLSILAASPSPQVAVAVQTPQGTVVLLHGLWRTPRSMAPLIQPLEDAGYHVVNLAYPSRDTPVPDLVEHLAEELERCCATSPRPLHFVTHSLGGIVLRGYLQEARPEGLGRVVMISPPNDGSEVVDQLQGRVFRWMMGPAAAALGTDSASALQSLGPAEFELGVITGDETLNPLFSRWIPGPDDGKVSIESAQVEGMDDFVVVPHSHPFIMRADVVIEQVLAFLATGEFERELEVTKEDLL